MTSVSDSAHRRILIVEDDALVRMVGVEMLQDAGFEVNEAETADDAIAILEKSPEVELLFTDIDMPGSMNGLELAALVHQRWPNVQLLVTSGKHNVRNSDVPDDGRFLPKPYSSITVVNQIADMLD